jgi:hypothetical protein
MTFKSSYNVNVLVVYSSYFFKNALSTAQVIQQPMTRWLLGGELCKAAVAVLVCHKQQHGFFPSPQSTDQLWNPLSLNGFRVPSPTVKCRDRSWPLPLQTLPKIRRNGGSPRFTVSVFMAWYLGTGTMLRQNKIWWWIKKNVQKS